MEGTKCSQNKGHTCGISKLTVLQELPDSVCQILEAALASQKNAELVRAAEESKTQKESQRAASANAEIIYSKTSDSVISLDLERTMSSSRALLTSRSQDESSETSSI